MFNGWDADVILPDLKIAIRWNGIWHYKKVRKNHNLELVKNRDRIKEKMIIRNGYIPYIIKDMGRYNTKFVDEQFEKFMKYLYFQ